ncbi:MAG: flagellar hook-basal body complex protein FliE [Steroidobacteraceae bacterium]
MSNMQINSVLAQIRSLSAQVKPVQPPSVGHTGGASQVGASSFADVLKQGLSQVNQTQQGADAMATAFQRGAPGVELADVMIEMQKASVSFRAVTEVRNRMVSAYQEIMNMQI